MTLQDSIASQDFAVLTSDAHSALLTVWNAQRAFIVELGRSLHAVLPSDRRPITLHGRDLKPGNEGVGAQLQYRLDDGIGGPGDACFVVDIALKRGNTSLIWEINAVSVEALGEQGYAISDRASFTLPVAHRSRMRELFVNDLTSRATEFLCRDRAVSTSTATTPR